MDENALEAMLARQRDAERGYRPQGSVRTEKTDEFEVYERKEAADQAQPAPAAPAPRAAVPQAPTAPPLDGSHAPLRPAPRRDGGARDFEELPGRIHEPVAPDMAQEPHTPAPVLDPEHAWQPQSAPAPVAPVQEPAPRQPLAGASPPAEATRPRRPQVWPPIQPREPAPAEAQPPAHSHAPEPAAPQAASDGGGCRIAIVQALFNQEITQQMAEAATAHAATAGAEVRHHVRVPGVYDLPLTAQTLARRKDVDAVVVIGCVIQGETDHDDLITFTTAKTLQEIALATQTPISLGIVGPGATWQQAEARIGNGAHAVAAAIAQWRALQVV